MPQKKKKKNKQKERTTCVQKGGRRQNVTAIHGSKTVMPTKCIEKVEMHNNTYMNDFFGSL